MRALGSLLLFACLGMAGCTGARVLSTVPVWPFERLEIETRNAGVIFGYLSIPETPPQRLAVVIQTPWCDWWPDGYDRIPTVSTSGIIREQLRGESAFLQFERPAIRGAGALPEPTCCPDVLDRFTGDRWARGIGEAIAAVRRATNFAGPVMLFSVGLGAVPAFLLAHRDASIVSVVVLNGYGLDGFESLPRPAQARVTIAHSELNDYAPLERMLVLAGDLEARGGNVGLIVANGVSFDVGAQQTLDCFEELAKLLAQRALANTQVQPDAEWTCAGAGSL